MLNKKIYLHVQRTNVFFEHASNVVFTLNEKYYFIC